MTSQTKATKQVAPLTKYRIAGWGAIAGSVLVCITAYVRLVKVPGARFSLLDYAVGFLGKICMLFSGVPASQKRYAWIEHPADVLFGLFALVLVISVVFLFIRSVKLLWGLASADEDQNLLLRKHMKKWLVVAALLCFISLIAFADTGRLPLVLTVCGLDFFACLLLLDVAGT